jgi:hypothetical protein
VLSSLCVSISDLQAIVPSDSGDVAAGKGDVGVAKSGVRRENISGEFLSAIEW